MMRTSSGACFRWRLLLRAVLGAVSESDCIVSVASVMKVEPTLFGFLQMKHTTSGKVCCADRYMRRAAFLAATGASTSWAMSTPFELQGWRNRVPLPPFLEEMRLPDGTPLGMARFLPANMSELLPAVFATWNVLDSIMYALEPGEKYQTGYVRELQVRRMIELILRPNTSTYCEIGMNGGHSLAAMLLANPNVIAHVFDLFKWRYSSLVANILNTTFRGRVSFYPGYSHHTLPKFTAASRLAGLTCDVMLVDGGHTFRAAHLDIEELQAVATSTTRVVLDDIGMPPGYALKVHNRTGTLKIEERYGPYKARALHNPCMRSPPEGRKGAHPKGFRMCPFWGFAVSRYLRPGVPRAVGVAPSS
jgi:hypothetical protein